MWYWWFDDRDNTWHAWKNAAPQDGDLSACGNSSFDGEHCSAHGDPQSKGRCDACRRVMAGT